MEGRHRRQCHVCLQLPLVTFVSLQQWQAHNCHLTPFFWHLYTTQYHHLYFQYNTVVRSMDLESEFCCLVTVNLGWLFHFPETRFSDLWNMNNNNICPVELLWSCEAIHEKFLVKYLAYSKHLLNVNFSLPQKLQVCVCVCLGVCSLSHKWRSWWW